MKTTDKITKILTDSNTAEARSHALLKILETTLARYEGKRITKRAIDTVKAALQPIGAQVNYNPSNYGDGVLQIWGIPGFPDYNNRAGYYLPSGEYSTEGLLKRNQWAGSAAVERMDRRKAVLVGGAIQRVSLAIDKFNAAKRDLDAALELLEDDKSQIRKELCD